jgi:hypothetical protein
MAHDNQIHERLTAEQVRDFKSLCEAGMHLGGAKLEALRDEVLRLQEENANLVAFLEAKLNGS